MKRKNIFTPQSENRETRSKYREFFNLPMAKIKLISMLSVISVVIILLCGASLGTRRGLIAQWIYHGSVAASGTAYDVSGNANDGTLIDNAFIDSNGINLDGSGDWLNSGNNTSLDFGTGAMSVSMWINPNGITSLKGLMYKNSGAGNPQFWIRNEYSGGARIRFAVASSSTAAIAATNYGDVQDNVWQYLACVFEGGASGTISVYLDGDLMGSDTYSEAVGYDNTADLIVGDFFDAYSSTHYSFNGKIDDIRIYNRALSAEEIKQIYYATKGRH